MSVTAGTRAPPLGVAGDEVGDGPLELLWKPLAADSGPPSCMSMKRWRKASSASRENSFASGAFVP
eukprot:3956311-Prymnesium_polylepis.2